MTVEGKGGHGDVLWNGLNFSNLTDVEDLCMKNCPPLLLDGLQLLASPKRIEIYGSSSILPQVQSAGHGIYQFPVEDLVIRKCDTSGRELTLLLSFFPNLSTFKTDRCKNITGLGVAGNAGTDSGEEQQQTRGNEEIITAAAAEGLMLLPLQLQDLCSLDCSELSLLSNPPHNDHAGGGGLQRLCSLSNLYVSGCPDFLSSYSSSSFFPFPTCLQGLTIYGLKCTETLSNLTSLTELALFESGGSRDEGLWPLLANGRLTHLTLHTSDFFTGSDLSWPHDKEMFSRSSKLLDLETRNDTGFLAAPICNLFSSTLTRLDLRFDNEVEHLTKEQDESLQLLTSLQELRFSNGQKLQRLPSGLHKLSNLKKLTINWCSAIQSLPNLPGTLQELVIRLCTAFKSLPNSLPSSLEILNIYNCTAIKSLPKDGLPSSMRELDVCDKYNSEELKRECRKLIGTIPIIRT